MGKLISASLNVLKIDKTKLFKGDKGTYLKITISINDQIDQFGNNVSVWEEQSKEEREAKVQRNYLGNGKIVFDGSTGSVKNKSCEYAHTLPLEDDLPF